MATKLKISPDESLFKKIKSEATSSGIRLKTTQSKLWFRKNLKNLKLAKKRVLNDERLKAVSKPLVGGMYMYVYDPKHKKTLPLYDKFPLIIMVEGAKGGFYGINLHYLSPLVRARFLDKLMETAPENPKDMARLKITYGLLKGVKKYKEFKPCFKRYLTSHIRSKMVRVPMSEWDIAIFLPTENFAKVKKDTVYRYSRRLYAN